MATKPMYFLALKPNTTKTQNSMKKVVKTIGFNHAETRYNQQWAKDNAELQVKMQKNEISTHQLASKLNSLFILSCTYITNKDIILAYSISQMYDFLSGDLLFIPKVITDIEEQKNNNGNKFIFFIFAKSKPVARRLNKKLGFRLTWEPYFHADENKSILTKERAQEQAPV